MIHPMPSALSGVILVLCAALTMASQARAQEFPNRTIRLLVGFPAGGPSDVPARLIAEQMQKALGQSVVVENKTGAAGMIALNEMLAPAARRAHAAVVLLSRCRPIRCFTRASPTRSATSRRQPGVQGLLRLHRARLAAGDSMQEFIAYAKARPGQLNYGKVGAGSVTELLAKQLEKVAGISMVGVPFKGTGPALQEVIGRPARARREPAGAGAAAVRGRPGQDPCLTSPERLSVAPAVPTLVEQGVPIANYGWWGMCAGPGTPNAGDRQAQRRGVGRRGLGRLQVDDAEAGGGAHVLHPRPDGLDHLRDREGFRRPDQGARDQAAGVGERSWLRAP